MQIFASVLRPSGGNHHPVLRGDGRRPKCSRGHAHRHQHRRQRSGLVALSVRRHFSNAGRYGNSYSNRDTNCNPKPNGYINSNANIDTLSIIGSGIEYLDAAAG
jgi:hypothetical protein